MEPRRAFTCFYCAETFAAFSTFVEHLKSHEGSEWFLCSKCLVRKKKERRYELAPHKHKCQGYDVLHQVVTVDSLAQATFAAYGLPVASFMSLHGVQRRKRSRGKPSAALGAPPPAPGVEEEEPAAPEPVPVVERAMITDPLPEPPHPQLLPSVGLFERTRIMASPTDHVPTGRHLVDFLEDGDSYVERFHMTRPDLALPSVRPLVRVCAPLHFAERVTIGGVPMFKVPAVHMATGALVFLLAPATIGNPGRIFNSCPEFDIVPAAKSPEDCEWLLKFEAKRVNVICRCISWQPRPAVSPPEAPTAPTQGPTVSPSSFLWRK